MARQAGASFHSEEDSEQLPEAGQQLALDGLGPAPGDLMLNTHTGIIGCVVSFETRRKGWVTIRHNNRQTTVPLEWIGKHWVPCRPDGTPS